MTEQGNQETTEIDNELRALQLRGIPDRGTIRLVAPADGAVTSPLQKHPWPVDNSPVREKPGEGWQKYLSDDDRSLPRAITFIWEPPEGQDSALHYDLIIATDAHLREKVKVVRGLAASSANVYNLRVGTHYFWRVIGRTKGHHGGVGQAQAASNIGYFQTNPATPRWINVPGITNVRDLGGWPLPDGARVRQGMIYRGSEMNSHCDIRDEGRCVLIEDLGIRTDLDLRGLGEDRAPVLDPRFVEYVNIPVLAYDSIAIPEYTGRYRALFSLLSRPSIYPVFMHCWGGADRTGTVAFLIQALLGVRQEDLFMDYELTSLSIWGERLQKSEVFQEMLQTLELFSEKGSSIQKQVERYCIVIGVTKDEIEAIREILVEHI